MSIPFNPEQFYGYAPRDWSKAFEAQTNRLEKIMVLLPVTAVILLFLALFGSFRRCCVNRAFTLVASAAYRLSPAVIAYTLGLMQSAPFKSSHFPVWAVYLVVVLGSADSYTAHSIRDIEQWKSFNVDAAAKCFMTSWMIFSYVEDSVIAILCTVLLFIILFTKLVDRAQALMLASNSGMQEKFKLIADYTSAEHQWNGSSDIDLFTMRGYKYLVRVADKAKVRSLCSTANYQQLSEMNEVITVEQVWNCKGRLLSKSGGDPDGRLKDLCLSFSLFKFICLTFAGYSLPQEAHKKLWRLIEQMLSEENGYKRVFRVIEVELAFLFDLLFTKYPINLSPHRSLYRLLQLSIVVAAALISLPFLRGGIYSVRALVTVLLMMSILVVELAQFVIMILSEWAKVIYICKYVRDERWQKNRCAEKLIEIMCRVQLLKPWGRQLRQYSLLKSYNYSPWKCINNRLAAAYVDLKRNGQEQIAPTNLSEQVLKAIAQSLRENCTSNLKKGLASLRLNHMFHQLSWACRHETTTHVIMVWHVATTFCEHEAPLRGPQLSKEPEEHFGIATKLSQYLAYLVAFAPRLLPDHPYRTQSIFCSAVSEARDLFKESSVSIDKRIEKLKGIDGEQCQENIVCQGVKLGRQLVSGVADEERIWKVLADFWAEMMLYVAPSNDAAAHADYLPTGGEFVTHVWVLVSHVGITRELNDGE